jgi:uncharacterized cupin superfamily protein
MLSPVHSVCRSRTHAHGYCHSDHFGGPMKTLLKALSSIPVSNGLPGVPNADIRYNGRYEMRLANAVGITQFGVNHVTLKPGAFSANRHWHEAEDEFVYVLSGSPTLVDDNGKQQLKPGDFIGFPAGEPNAHHVVNDSDFDAVIMVVGSRRPGEEVIHYPDDNFGPIRK